MNLDFKNKQIQSINVLPNGVTLISVIFTGGDSFFQVSPNYITKVDQQNMSTTDRYNLSAQ